MDRGDLFRLGLVKRSFIPELDIRILRKFTRYKLTSMRSSEKKRTQSVFTVCNVALDFVVSDMFGKSATLRSAFECRFTLIFAEFRKGSGSVAGDTPHVTGPTVPSYTPAFAPPQVVPMSENDHFPAAVTLDLIDDTVHTLHRFHHHSEGDAGRRQRGTGTDLPSTLHLQQLLRRGLPYEHRHSRHVYRHEYSDSVWKYEERDRKTPPTKEGSAVFSYGSAMAEVALQSEKFMKDRLVFFAKVLPRGLTDAYRGMK